MSLDSPPCTPDGVNNGRTKTIALTFTLTALALAALAPDCFAADGAEDFKSIYDRLIAWTGGSLGKALSLAFLIVGLLAGLLRGSLLAAITSIGAGIALISIPSILNSIFAGA